MVIFKYFLLLLVVVVVEEFVVRVFQGGKVTVPKRLRELFNVENGDYSALSPAFANFYFCLENDFVNASYYGFEVRCHIVF